MPDNPNSVTPEHHARPSPGIRICRDPLANAEIRAACSAISLLFVDAVRILDYLGSVQDRCPGVDGEARERHHPGDERSRFGEPDM
jgi:hypothetical protein